VIDVELESLLTFREARKLPILRRDGRQPDLATLYRWSSVGCRGVVLDSCQLGSTRMTSREAIVRFITALSDRAPVSSRPSAGRSHEAAVRELQADGIC
jgi:hypothetical protein